MYYDIQLGFLAADAISEFSKATSTKDAQQYMNFLDRTTEYCKAVRKTYGRPVETDVPAAMEENFADFMRTVIKAHQPSPTITAKLEAVSSLEEIVQQIRREQRSPSDEECLRIAKAIYTTSAGDPR